MDSGAPFGSTPDGEPVRRFVIGGGGLRASILTYGAIVQDLRIEGHDAPLTLGYERFEDYLGPINYFGAVVGRYANRIRDGRFTLAGQRYAVDAAHPEAHGLHGGQHGFARRNWAVAGHGDDFVALSLTDPDGMMGFPGMLSVSCTYRAKAPGTLSVEFTAEADQPTLCNLAHHAYFNLEDGGSGSFLDHRMMIPAGAYLPVDGDVVPTGAILPVDGTPFDFRTPRPVRFETADGPMEYDHNFCLSSARGALRQAAWVQAPGSGVEMEIWTTEPGLQFYSGQYLLPDRDGLDGRRYRKFGGFCLEPQVWPDSPNRPYFPQALLTPGDLYRQTTEFRFRA